MIIKNVRPTEQTTYFTLQQVAKLMNVSGCSLRELLSTSLKYIAFKTQVYNLCKGPGKQICIPEKTISRLVEDKKNGLILTKADEVK